MRSFFSLLKIELLCYIHTLYAWMQTCTRANTERHLFPRLTHALTPFSIYALHGVYFSPSLFVNGNGGAPKGRWRGNKWRIFSLLNGALEGLWLGVVGYKTQRFGCTHVLVHWLTGWQLCCLGVVLGHALGHALRCSFGTGALSGPTGGRFREKPSPTWRLSPLHQSEWYKTASGGGM